MTIRENLSSYYLLLAGEFGRRGVSEEALACVLMARRLGCDRLRAHEMLQVAASQPVEAEPAVTQGDLASLQATKWKLDRSTCTELAVPAGCLEHFASGADPGAVSTANKDDTGAAAALLKEMARLKERMKRERGREAGCIVKNIERLLTKVRQQVKDTSASESPGATSRELQECFFGKLSLEHEMHNLANDLYKIGMFHESIEAYSMALEIQPDLLESYFNRGLAKTRLSRYGDAWEDLTKVLDMNAQLPEAWYTRGLIHEYMLEYDKAIADYQRALEVDPKYERARSQIEIAERKKAGQTSRCGAGDTSHSGSREEGLITDFSVFLMKSTLRFCDVSGCDEAIRALKMAALCLAGDPAVDEFGGQVPAGIMLWGPKGVGKTRCVLALAGEVGCRVYALPPTALMDMWAGNSEKNVRNLWQEASAHAPSVIYIDEIDGFLSRRTRSADGDSWYNKLVTTVLFLMSQVTEQRARVMLVGATNRICDIEPAFLRPGRFDEVVSIPLPNARTLAGIWLIQLEKAEQAAKRIDFLSDELRRAVHFDRTQWMDLAMTEDACDGSGIPELARICEHRKLTGADVVGVIRAAITDRIYARKEGEDKGPISPSDLKTQLLVYEPPQWRSRRHSSRQGHGRE